jgi:cysteine synthase A
MAVERSDSWAARAIRLLRADGGGNAPTPLRRIALPASPGIEVYLKGESAHPTGSVKHHLVRVMFHEAVARGAVTDRDPPVIAAAGGAAAVAGA